MRACAAAISSLVFCSFLSAQPVHVFLGAAGQWQWVGLIPIQTGSASSHLDDAGILTPSNNSSGLGGLLECGLATGAWSVALGFNHHSIRETDGRTNETSYSYSHWETTEYATNDRVLLNFRVTPFEHDPNPVKPLIGINFSWGWLTRKLEHQNINRYNDYVAWSIDESVSQRSKGFFGTGFELGLISRVNREIYVCLLGRAEWYDSSVEPKNSDSGTSSLSRLSATEVAALQLGLQYHFRHNN